MRDNRCDHHQTPLQGQDQKQSQRRNRSQRQSAKSSSLSRLSFNLGVVLFYFLAMKMNAMVFGLDFVVFDEDVFLSVEETRQYFFNASIVSFGCLSFIALAVGKATKSEKIYGVTYFASLVMSALRYNNSEQQEWFWLYDLDIVMQYGITASLCTVAAIQICQLLRFCYAYVVRCY